MLLIANKIKTICKDRKIPIKDLASAIKMSEPGFHRMIEKESMKVKNLQLIADFFGVPITYFFDEPVEVNKEKVIDEVMQELSALLKESMKKKGKL